MTLSVSVRLEGRLMPDEATMQAWTGTWCYFNCDIEPTPLPFVYKRASTEGTLPAWQEAMLKGAPMDRILELWDPPCEPTGLSTPPVQPSLRSVNSSALHGDAPSSNSSPLAGACTALPGQPFAHGSSMLCKTEQAGDPADQGSLNLSATATSPTNMVPAVTPPSTITATTTSPTNTLSVTSSSPASAPPPTNEPSSSTKLKPKWSGWWEGQFALLKHGKQVHVQETFVLAPKACTDGEKCGGGTNVIGCGVNPYGRFQLEGRVDEEKGTLVCERAYVILPRKRRKRSTEKRETASGGEATLASYNTRKRRVPCKFDTWGRDDEIATSPSAGTRGGGGSHRANRTVATQPSPVGSPAATVARSASAGEQGDSVSGVASLPVGVGTSHESVSGATGSAAQSTGEKKHKASKKKATAHEPRGETQDGWRSASYDEEANEFYEGEVEHEQRHGFGVAVYCAFGDHMYEGEWSHGKEHGRGTLMTSERSVIYEGEWVDGKITGTGAYFFPEGDAYTGDWRENLRHGKGIYTLKSGSRYEGEWQNHKRSGKGKFTWADGSIYEGDWLDDQRHGRGFLERSDGFWYEGQWASDEFDGRGICMYPDGVRYEGMWKAGKKDGRGSLTFPNGTSYEGRFREDRIDGQGTVHLTKPTTTDRPGEWMIPIEFQSDMSRIHAKAGFDKAGK